MKASLGGILAQGSFWVAATSPDGQGSGRRFSLGRRPLIFRRARRALLAAQFARTKAYTMFPPDGRRADSSPGARPVAPSIGKEAA